METTCTSERLFASKIIGFDPHLRYIPVMITRLLLSLKKANASKETTWNFGEPAAHTTMRFADRRGAVATRDEIRLDTFTITQEGTKSGVMV